MELREKFVPDNPVTDIAPDGEGDPGALELDEDLFTEAEEGFETQRENEEVRNENG